MTPNQALACALDPSQMGQLAGLPLDPYQAEAVRAATAAGGRSLWAWARQSGKTFAAAVLVEHSLLFAPGSLVLHVGPRLEQGRLLAREVVRLHRALGAPVRISGHNVESIVLDNGSRLQIVPASQGGRGYSAVSLLIADELAHMSNAAEVMAALSPTLAIVRGRLVGMSTFNGANPANWFYAEWSEGEGYARSLVTADDCPRLTAEFLEQERRSMGDSVWRQEYFCEPRSPTGAVFPWDLVRSLIDGLDVAADGDSGAGVVPQAEALPRMVSSPTRARLLYQASAPGFVRSEI